MALPRKKEIELPKESDYLLIEKVDRLENHFKVYKSDMQDVKDILKSVQSCLVGTNLNNNRGVVHLLDDLEERVNNMEKRTVIYEEVVTGLKWTAGTTIGAIVTFFIWFMTKK